MTGEGGHTQPRFLCVDPTHDLHEKTPVKNLLVNTHRYKEPLPVVPIGRCSVAASVEAAGFEVQILGASRLGHVSLVHERFHWVGRRRWNAWQLMTSA